jgi:uncharacterized membrane protein
MNLPIPALDIIALISFIAMWAAYSSFADRTAKKRPNLMSALYIYRKQWMYEMMRRDNRIVDTAALNNLLQPCTFFASTTILILGGVLALLAAPDSVANALAALPFTTPSNIAQAQGRLLFEVKVFTLVGVFAYAFFKFTWAMRQYSTCTVLVVSAPPAAESPIEYRDHVERFAVIASLAGENFNMGLRGYYFGVAAVTWFLNPWALMLATAWVGYLLYQREFHSRTLAALTEQLPNNLPPEMAAKLAAEAPDRST